ncbi:seipin-1 [Diospyros lotus]|uniref:seipin-1 n=1 Tax=Diospyros lotus TaxID=55363 RepID=UPI002253CC91|nr:seipin-1 [Diospyros lotus]
MATPPKRPRHRTSTTSTGAPPHSVMQMEEPADLDYSLPIPNPPFWFTNLLSFQADITYNFLASLLSPFFPPLTLVSPDETKEGAETVAPSALTGGGGILRKIGMGVLGSMYVCMVLVVVMVVAAVLGVALVQYWVEEPVFVREELYFDYTEVHPQAVFRFGGAGGKKKMVPVGHTFDVSLSLVLPESDFNREVGVFQLSAELISSNGEVIHRSSRPCMLRFRSLPIRLSRTFLMGMPLILGITSETQKLTVQILNHKEGYPRTEAVRISVIPRAGTFSAPQVYEAEIAMNSQLPWTKELVRRWKWTFCVWASLYIYITLLIVLFCGFKPIVFPFSAGEREPDWRELEQRRKRGREEAREYSEELRKWQRSRSKRKAMILRRALPPDDDAGSSASSFTVSKEETIVGAGEDAGDSELVRFEGAL